MGKSTPAQDRKKIGSMLAELNKIKAEMLPEEQEDKDRQQEIKSMDPFTKKKLELNTVMHSIRQDLKQLQDVRSAGNNKNATEIRLKATNTKRIQACKTMITELETLLQAEKKEDARQRKKSRSAPEPEPDPQLAKKEQLILTLGRELNDFQVKNSGVKLKLSEDEKNMEERVQTRAAQEKEERRNARAGKKTKRSSIEGRNKDMKVEICEEDFRDVKPQTEQEQMFMDQVEIQVQEQDKLLDMIGQGMDELKELGQDMNKALKFQNEMAPELANQLDKVNVKLDSANKRLNDLFDNSGGMTRWCPMCVCFIILLALVGYIVNMFT